MDATSIDAFFRELSQRISFPVHCIVLGGAAATLLGGVRATYDVDFEVHLKGRSRGAHDRDWQAFDQAVDEVVKITGIKAQYAEDVDRWGMIILPKKRPLPYKRFGPLKLFLMDPRVWAIGKLTRFLSTDIDDMITVFHKRKVSPIETVRLWGQALSQSPRSLVQGQFKKNVLYFLDRHGPSIWGSTEDLAHLKIIFLSTASQARLRGSRT